MNLLELDQVSFSYSGQMGEALINITLEVKAGEIIYICGPTGSGKSTLLNCLKREIRPVGELTGSILYMGRDMDTYTDRTLIQEIGIVFQNPDNQTVMDTVVGEMMFGLENLGLERLQIEQRLAEIAGYFGIESLLREPLHHLSGGEKQKVNLCAVLAMRPRLLLLDEPLAQLDPVAQTELVDILRRLNQEFGITIIISEHNKDDIMVGADKILILNKGEQRYFGTLQQVAAQIIKGQDEIGISFLPTPTRLFAKASRSFSGYFPVTVKDARHLLAEQQIFSRKDKQVARETAPSNQPVLSAHNLLFAYRSAPTRPVLRNLDFSTCPGDFISIVGGNASGKSTLLKILCGLLDPLDGRVQVGRKNIKRMKKKAIGDAIFYVPQNPLTYFTYDTVAAELKYAADQGKATAESFSQTINRFNMAGLLKMHPYDLSGGELQKVLLACAVLRQTQILLLDEATKGLDGRAKQELGYLLREQSRRGKTIVLVSHDLEFVAGFADKCTLLFNGKLSMVQSAHDFFHDNYFYTTIAKRIFRESLPGVLTIDEVKAYA